MNVLKNVHKLTVGTGSLGTVFDPKDTLRTKTGGQWP